jgi:hypothetical protein
MTHVATREERHEAENASGRRPGALARAIVLWLCVAALLVTAVFATWGALSREVYGAGAFVREYLDALSAGDAAAALALPGVSIDREKLADAGLPAGSSDALLRTEALGKLTDVRFVSDVAESDGSRSITFEYVSGGKQGRSTFSVSSAEATFGLFPSWRFERSPLSSVSLTVVHSTSFRANGFELDTRQVAPTDQAAAFTNTVSLLTFTPSTIDFDLDTTMLRAPVQTARATDPRSVVTASVDTTPTKAFVTEVQTQLNSYLDECATQVVLQPTRCPFGQFLRDRVKTTPAWSMVTYPTVQIQPGETTWVMPATVGTAHLVVDVQSLFDGEVTTLDEDVPFTLSAFVTVREDGSLYIDLR